MGKILDFFKNTFRRSKSQPGQVQPREQLRTIIHDYYGNNVGWFAYNYASNIYQIPEVRTAIQSFAEIFSKGRRTASSTFAPIRCRMRRSSG